MPLLLDMRRGGGGVCKDVAKHPSPHSSTPLPLFHVCQPNAPLAFAGASAVSTISVIQYNVSSFGSKLTLVAHAVWKEILYIATMS